MYISRYDTNLKEVKKGDVITCYETEYYNNSTAELKLRVDRVNKLTLSVICIDGYMKGSSWKIRY